MTNPRTQHELGDLHWRMERAQAETKSCRGCGAEVGAHCRNPYTGADLRKLPAHWQRIKDAREEADR